MISTLGHQWKDKEVDRGHSIDASEAQQAELELVKRLCFVFAATDDVSALDSAIRIAKRWPMLDDENRIVLLELVRTRERWTRVSAVFEFAEVER